MAASLRFSVIIPAFNEEQYIGACLRALYTQKDEIDEVILVDNNSTDATVEVARKAYPGIKIVVEKRQGISAARTRGFNEARGDILGRIDADTIVMDDWARMMKRSFEDSKTVGVVGSIGFTSFMWRRRPMKLVIWLYELRRAMFAGLKAYTTLMIGCNMAIRRSAWEKIADEADVDPIYHEDLALSLIIGKHGTVRYDRRPMVAVPLRRYLSVRKMASYLKRDKLTVQKYNRT